MAPEEAVAVLKKKRFGGASPGVEAGHQGSHHVLMYAGPKIEQPFLPPTAPRVKSLLIFAPNPRNKNRKTHSFTRHLHTVHCILYDAVLRLRLSLFGPHVPVSPLIAIPPAAGQIYSSTWCDSNPASNCRQGKGIGTKYFASTKKIQQKRYNKSSASAVRLPRRVCLSRAAASSFLPPPLSQDCRNSAIFAQPLSIFEQLVPSQATCYSTLKPQSRTSSITPRNDSIRWRTGAVARVSLR